VRRPLGTLADVARLIVVSNRVSVPGNGAPPGGLAVGVLAALRGPQGGVWFGWSGNTADKPALEGDVREKDGIRFVTVDLPSEHFDKFYNGFCNGTLWPLHHYFIGQFRYDSDEFDSYMAVNRHFANALLKIIEDGDRIWVHDYHLMPLAGMLRQAKVTAPIGFFLHIPYPNIAMLRLLPTYAELVRDLCQYDLVGFQTAEDLDGFISAVAAVFPEARIGAQQIELNNRRIGIGVFPISVDVDVIAQQAAQAASEDDQVKRLVASLLGRKLLLGVDRLDYSKGLLERFTSYRALLESAPDLQGKITFIQIAPLSRQHVAAYVEIRDALERAAGHTNGQFADTDWTPVRYLNRDFAHQTLSGFLRVANVGVVTPVRDGMNLVAKEFVAAQDPEDPGALVLSKLAGAAYELAGALLINPYDKNAVARALRQALSMPLAERRERHETNMKALRANTISLWHQSFVSRLSA
jgi:trehalose 6-phosphate synthase